jgi:hypothetical protein
MVPLQISYSRKMIMEICVEAVKDLFITVGSLSNQNMELTAYHVLV